MTAAASAAGQGPSRSSSASTSVVSLTGPLRPLRSSSRPVIPLSSKAAATR